MFTNTQIRKNEIGLVFRRGDLARVLAPGRHRVWQRPFGRDELERVDVLVTRFRHALLDVLIQDEALREELEIVEVSDAQRAFVWKDGRLFDIVGPGRHAYWKRPYALEVEVIDVDETAAFQHGRLDAILRHERASHFLRTFRVDEHERVIVRRDGVPLGVFERGVHVFWHTVSQLTVSEVDLREQSLDVTGQEIMTKDRVTLRVTLVASFRVIDVERMLAASPDASQTLYRSVQLALREAVAARDLDDLLADRESVGAELRSAVAARADALGLELTDLGVRDVILPGEMKSILNQVIEATKRAEANLIRRREETAAARSQANTAKLYESTPALRRMKELEALQEILKGANATFVIGQDDLLGQFERLTRSAGERPDSG